MKTSLLCCLLCLPALTWAADRDQQCKLLLPAMQTVLQALRRGQSLTPDQQATWRTWNADCKAAKWQQQLAETAPPPPPLEKNFPKMLPPPERPEAPEAPITEVLPSGFVGADPQSTVESFKNSLSQIPIKIDQYSTATERAQFDQLRAQQFNSLELLYFTLLESHGQCQKKYNPDAQLFSFALSPQGFPRFSEIYKLSGAKLSVFEERQSLGNYEASNAFGVTVTVKRESIKEISLALPDEPSNVPQSLRDAQYSLSKTKYKFSVQVASSEAREGYALKAGQLTYDCRYSTTHGMPVTGGRGFRGLKPLWYNSVPP